MHITSLRKVGGSVMVTLPPAFLEQLNLKHNSPVELFIKDNHLIINPITKPSYTLEELLAASDYESLTTEERNMEWIDNTGIGNELL